MSPPLLTERLALRAFAPTDAAFVLALVNSPGWLRYIGDRGLRTAADAEASLAHGPIASCARHGFELLHVSRREDGAPVGMCGLLKRDTLPDGDLGFAFLGAHEGRGYASESGHAVLERARQRHGLRRLAAIVQPGNAASRRVLAKLGFIFERDIRLPRSLPPCPCGASRCILTPDDLPP